MPSGPSPDSSPSTPPTGPGSTYRSLIELVYADRPLADTLQKMSVLASEALGESPQVSLTLVEGEQGWTAATSGPVALDLDQRQYDDEEGPCLDAARYAQTVRLTIDAPDQPYAGLREAARSKGVDHTLSIGFPTGVQVMGAMNIYGSSGRPFSARSEELARTFAVCIGIVLSNAEQYREAATRAAHLEEALRSRATIEQAKGILMARFRCTSDEAFARLARQSQADHVKIRVLAQRLVGQVPPGPTEKRR